MTQELKGWLGEKSKYFGVEVRWIYFPCPTTNKALNPHNECVPVHEGSSIDNNGHPVWHYEIRPDGKCAVTPSIDASHTPCGFHDFYVFTLVPEGEIAIEGQPL